jgi:hypothetical protein
MNYRLKLGESVIGLVIGIIMIVAVLLPVTQNIVDNSTSTGTTKTIVQLLPLFVALLALLFISRGGGLME